jgi:hypothetical protein
VRRIYTACDNRKDESRLFDGLNALVQDGVKPGEIFFYMLIGYWPRESHDDREYWNSWLFRFPCRTPERARSWAFSGG